MPASTEVCVVLVGTTHPGNIGAAARAMKVMGLAHLRLVAPRVFPSPQAVALAAGADDVLERATVHPTLDQAIADCATVVGVSARPRAIACPLYPPREGMARLAAEPAGRVALLFGREHSGLSNEEMDRCHYQLRIPTDPAFPSLNVAAAVQVIAYEWRLARFAAEGGGEEGDDAQPGADAGEMERFYRHLEEVLVETGFLDPSKPRHLMRRLRRLYNRAQPDRNEVNILRGMLTAVQGYAEHLRRREGG
jgi:TrmH family RNA methyltransferase